MNQDFSQPLLQTKEVGLSQAKGNPAMFNKPLGSNSGKTSHIKRDTSEFDVFDINSPTDKKGSKAGNLKTKIGNLSPKDDFNNIFSNSNTRNPNQFSSNSQGNIGKELGMNKFNTGTNPEQANKVSFSSHVGLRGSNIIGSSH